MGMFNIFRTPQPQQFRYFPRHYDPDKEELKQRLQHLDKDNADNSPEAIKQRISTGFRRKQNPDPSFRRRHVRKSNRRLIRTLVVLILLTAYFLYKYLPAIMGFVD